MSQPPFITMTTDFGHSDMYVGVMKGVVLSIARQAHLIDLTHNISPQNVLEAGARLEAALDFFPPGTIHLVIVDPGVGSQRAALVVQTADCLFVAPDNGVLTLPLRRCPAQSVIKLDEAAQPYLRHPISATFHGRDVFAPIAAHLAAGTPPGAFGKACSPEELVTLTVPEPEGGVDPTGRPYLRLHSLYADHFGNLITDLTPERWAAWRNEIGATSESENEHVIVEAAGAQWRGFARTFADVKEGCPLAYWGSAGRLEIAVRNGSAMQTLPLSLQDEIMLRFAA